MPDSKETIFFTFEFDSEWTDSPPEVEIRNNDQQIVPTVAIEFNKKIECAIELDPNKKNNVLQIIRTNHDGHTRQTCCLVTLTADGNNLAPILNHTEFYPTYPRIWHQEQISQGKDWPKFHKGWLNWGWNGCWKMHYDAPFYDWLLKNL